MIGMFGIYYYMNKKALILSLPVLALTLLVGCKNQGSDADSVAVQEDPQVVFEDFSDTVEIKTVPVEKEKKTPRVTTRQAVKKAPVTQRNNSKAETIYVETEGAQGRVWGHVTMKGDRGTGTIHDWDENTWTVTVTRHGNELFAVDQNSRQYVFRLK